MAQCDQCGNEYDRAFSVTLHDGTTGQFDSFQCAVAKLAPRCAHCDGVVIGHGRETADDRIFCCAHCADRAGAILEH